MLTRLNGIYPAVVIGSFYLFDMECHFPQGKNKELEDEIVRLRNEAEIQKISFEKALFDVENNYKKAITEACAKHIEVKNLNMENRVDISCQTVEIQQIGNKEDKSNFGSETAKTL